MKRRVGQCPLGSQCEEVKEENGEQVMVICPWYVEITGKDPQSEDNVKEWRCAMAWMPLLMIENAQMSRQTGAAVESFRNEMTKQNVALGQALAQNQLEKKQ